VPVSAFDSSPSRSLRDSAIAWVGAGRTLEERARFAAAPGSAPSRGHGGSARFCRASSRGFDGGIGVGGHQQQVGGRAAKGQHRRFASAPTGRRSPPSPGIGHHNPSEAEVLAQQLNLSTAAERGGRDAGDPGPAVAGGRSITLATPRRDALAEGGQAPGPQAASRVWARNGQLQVCESLLVSPWRGSVWRQASTPSAWVPREKGGRQLSTLPGSSPQARTLNDRVGGLLLTSTDRRSTQVSDPAGEPGGQCSAVGGRQKDGPAGSLAVRADRGPSARTGQGWPPQSVGRTPSFDIGAEQQGMARPRPRSWPVAQAQARRTATGGESLRHAQAQQAACSFRIGPAFRGDSGAGAHRLRWPLPRTRHQARTLAPSSFKRRSQAGLSSRG